MDDLVNHLEDRVGKLQHSIWNELNYHIHAAEEALTQYEIVLLK